MNVKELIQKLKKEKSSLEVRLFAGDHDPQRYDHGIGTPNSVWETTNEKGKQFVAICT